MYLFDTDTVSHIIKSSPSLPFIKRLALLSPKEQFTTTITFGELIYGAYKSSRPDYFLEKLEKLVWPNIRIVSFDEGSARVYGRMRAEMEKKGISLSEPDMRIAAIALHNNLTVVTGNVRHFSKVPNVKVENWL